MLFKTFVFLTCTLLIQGFNGETTEEVVNEYQPKIEALRNDIVSATNKFIVDINQTRSVIYQKVNATFTEVRSKINALREQAKEAEEQAQASGINIEECVIALNSSLKKLNLGPLALCYVNQELIVAQKGIKSLSNLQSNTTIIIDDCLKIYPSDDQVGELRKCLDYKIARITIEVKALQAGITLTLKRAIQSTDNCSSNAVTPINTSIETISENFEKCILDINQ